MLCSVKFGKRVLKYMTVTLTRRFIYNILNVLSEVYVPLIVFSIMLDTLLYFSSEDSVIYHPGTQQKSREEKGLKVD